MFFLNGLLYCSTVAFIDYDLGPFFDLIYFLLLACRHFLELIDLVHDSFLLSL